jgi:hypothetical protein
LLAGTLGNRISLTLGSGIPYNQRIRTAEFSGRGDACELPSEQPAILWQSAQDAAKTAFTAGTSEEFPEQFKELTPTQ